MRKKMTENIGLAGGNSVSRRRLLQSLVGLGAGYSASRLLLAPNVFAGASSSAASEKSAEFDIRTVQYPSGDAQIEAYLAAPKGEGRHPSILVIHDQAGLSEHIRDVARRFAREGFVALVPDLLSRAGGIGKVAPDEVTQSLSRLPVDQTILDLQKAYAYLQDNPAVAPKGTSSVGFGWGGWRNFLLAAAVDELRGVVMFSASTPLDGLRDIESPILAHYAQFDFRVTGNALWTAKTMKELGKKFTYHVYPHAKSDFFNDASPGYDAEAAKLAWTRTLEFLRAPS